MVANYPMVELPGRFADNQLMIFAERVAAQKGHQGWPSEIVFDFSTLNFIRPAGIVFLNNMLDWLSDHGCQIWFRNHTANRQVLNFLDDSQFFARRLGAPNRKHACCHDTTFELTGIRTNQTSEQMTERFTPWMACAVGCSAEANSMQNIETIIKEAFNNIEHHTRLNIGCICAQHFPAVNEIEIALADFGEGIPRKVRKKTCQAMTDSAAILKAFEQGFSTKSLPTNRGAGLPFIKDNCADLHEGVVTVYSGHGRVMFQKQNGNVTAQCDDYNDYCPGTVIKLIFKTNKLDTQVPNSATLCW